MSCQHEFWGLEFSPAQIAACRERGGLLSAGLAIALKDLRLLTRHRGDFFFVVAWPILLAILFGVIFAAPPEGRSPLAVAVADEDGTDGSRSFLARLGAGGGLDVAVTTDAVAEYLEVRVRLRSPSGKLIYQKTEVRSDLPAPRVTPAPRVFPAPRVAVAIPGNVRGV